MYQTRSLEVIKKSRGQRYGQCCTDWYEAYPWLVLCASRSKAFCGYCCYGKFKGLLTDKNADLAFIDTGFNNWKKALGRFDSTIAALPTLKYLVRQGLALRGHSEIEGNLMQLLLLRTSEYPELKHYMNDGKYFSHDIIISAHDGNVCSEKHSL